MKVARIRQSRIKRLVAGGVTPIEQEVLNVAPSSRSRFSRTLPTSGFPPGTYQLDVTVKSLKESPRTISREFDITEKPVTEKPVTPKPVTAKP